MSGGYFEYKQYTLNELVDQIERVIQNNNRCEWYQYGKETINKFHEAINVLKRAEVMVQRIDWLVSGDDGEDSFHERWREELENNRA